jgi:NTP pyrophosphatase (non-canonical NTP hydrolase)
MVHLLVQDLGKLTSNYHFKKDALLQLMVITMEECGELTQACSKSIKHNNHYTNKLLKEEIGDVYCMIQLLVEFGVVKVDDLEERALYKRKKLKTWSKLIDDI